MEISITEIVLFTWAALATGFALKYRDDEHKTRFFLKVLIEDEKAREKMVQAFEDFKKRTGAA